MKQKRLCRQLQDFWMFRINSLPIGGMIYLGFYSLSFPGLLDELKNLMSEISLEMTPGFSN